MNINPIFTHIPRAGLAPIAHASRRLRGKSAGVASIQAKLSTPTARDVLTLTHPDGSAMYAEQQRVFRSKRRGMFEAATATGTIRKAVAAV